VIGPELEERIRRMVDGWPPVSAETYAQLALLLAPEPRSITESAATPARTVQPAAA
jgi:hypothetical protein